MSQYHTDLGLMVTSLDRGEAAAAAYLLLASPAGYTEWTQNKARSRERGLPVRGRILACLQFIFIPVGILTGK
ncbi:hypothetical protein PBY51_011897 [Eleginops maclovinus]|uniref:Uncharacterized protein n=1 Tax=Eleginops maclovinus TaxID=56733 RepID=A0AAN8ALT6_ELEMC|nr:hypothetical protein PBY51_011897 [Eleginops maclovinus]